MIRCVCLDVGVDVDVGDSYCVVVGLDDIVLVGYDIMYVEHVLSI